MTPFEINDKVPQTKHTPTQIHSSIHNNKPNHTHTFSLHRDRPEHTLTFHLVVSLAKTSPSRIQYLQIWNPLLLLKSSVSHPFQRFCMTKQKISANLSVEVNFLTVSSSELDLFGGKVLYFHKVTKLCQRILVL